MIKLENISDPKFLKALTFEELEDLAKQIRKFIIENVSVTGGHLSSNLGTVELIIALHYVFNSPYDKFIFDVGHQAYTHKILTGRAKDFQTLRQYKGLSGFLKEKESVHDVWEAGHSSTSISAAAGFLEAKAAGADIGEVISIIGDGSIANGLAFSAINYLGTKTDQKVIIILNDNNMSISPNVGVLGKTFDKIRLKKSYLFVRKITPKFLKRMLTNAKGAISYYLHGNTLFTALGFRYFGPIDGHNLKELISFFQYAKKTKESVIIHVKTKKGYGYKFAEEDTTGFWHGVGPFNIENGKLVDTGEKNFISWSKAIGKIILELAKTNDKIRVITPAMVQGSGLSEFEKILPKQLIDVGIAEEHSVIMASAMAKSGLIPVVSIYSTFMQRSYDEISHDVARIKSKVLFLVDRAGIVGEDGSTHQGIYDVAFLSSIPNVVITMPKDLIEAKSLIKYAINNYFGPFVVRYPRGKIYKDDFENQEIPIEFGKWEIVLPIQKKTIITYGPAVNKFKSLILKNNLDIGLINARFIRPFDVELLKELNDKEIIVYEEVIKTGSLSQNLAFKILELGLNIKLLSYTIPDDFIEHGNAEIVKKNLGLDIEEILKNIKE